LIHISTAAPLDLLTLGKYNFATIQNQIIRTSRSKPFTLLERCAKPMATLFDRAINRLVAHAKAIKIDQQSKQAQFFHRFFYKKLSLQGYEKLGDGFAGWKTDCAPSCRTRNCQIGD
jgi:hypothetical protein